MKRACRYFAILALCLPAAHAQQARRSIAPALPALAAGERVASFALQIDQAWVTSIEGLPPGWSVELVNDPSSAPQRPPPHADLKAQALVGAAYLDAASFGRLRLFVQPAGRLRMAGTAVLAKPPGTQRSVPLNLRVGSAAPPDAVANGQAGG